MITKMFIMSTLLSISGIISAQTEAGGISSKMLQNIEREKIESATDKALRNAITGNAIDDLTKTKKTNPS